MHLESPVGIRDWLTNEVLQLTAGPHADRLQGVAVKLYLNDAAMREHVVDAHDMGRRKANRLIGPEEPILLKDGCPCLVGHLIRPLRLRGRCKGIFQLVAVESGRRAQPGVVQTRLHVERRVDVTELAARHKERTVLVARAVICVRLTTQHSQLGHGHATVVANDLLPLAFGDLPPKLP